MLGLMIARASVGMHSRSNYKEISVGSSFPFICKPHGTRVGRGSKSSKLKCFFLHTGTNAVTAPSSLHASLQNVNENYLRDSLSGKIGVPAVRALRAGAFEEFRKWTRGSAAVGTVKVPVVVWDERCRMWLEGRIVGDV